MENTKYDIFWECIYSLRYPTCWTQRFQAFSFMQTYVAQNWLLGTLLCNLLHWKTLNMTYSESVFIALGIQHVKHSGFKQSVSCKFTFHETGCLEPVPLLYKLLQWKNTKYYIFWACIIALSIQHAKRMRHIIMCLAPLYNIFNIIL